MRRNPCSLSGVLTSVLCAAVGFFAGASAGVYTRREPGVYLAPTNSPIILSSACGTQHKFTGAAQMLEAGDYTNTCLMNDGVTRDMCTGEIKGDMRVAIANGEVVLKSLAPTPKSEILKDGSLWAMDLDQKKLDKQRAGRHCKNRIILTQGKITITAADKADFSRSNNDQSSPITITENGEVINYITGKVFTTLKAGVDFTLVPMTPTASPSTTPRAEL